MKNDNPINSFYDYLKKGKYSDYALDVIKTLYEERKFEKGYVNKKDVLYKYLKKFTAFANKTVDGRFVFDSYRSCRIIFERYRKKFKELSELKYSNVDKLHNHLGDLVDSLFNWEYVYCNTAVIYYKEKNDDNSPISIVLFRDMLDVFFDKKYLDDAYEEIKLFFAINSD